MRHRQRRLRRGADTRDAAKSSSTCSPRFTASVATRRHVPQTHHRGRQRLCGAGAEIAMIRHHHRIRHRKMRPAEITRAHHGIGGKQRLTRGRKSRHGAASREHEDASKPSARLAAAYVPRQVEGKALSARKIASMSIPLQPWPGGFNRVRDALSKA